MRFANRADHAFADDMIREAAERLCTDDIFVTRFDQFEHLRRQQPALAHLAAATDEWGC